MAGQVRDRLRVNELGEVFTRPSEVNLMLDLVADLFPTRERPGQVDRSFLEPSCGTGNFLVEIVRRKLRFVPGSSDPETMALAAVGSVFGVDLDPGNVAVARSRVRNVIGQCVLDAGPGFWANVDRLLVTNLVACDFLDGTATDQFAEVDVVVGNPPYQAPGTGGQQSPVYQHHVERAIGLRPGHVVMLIPARWGAGGWKQLDSFRASMLADRRVRTIVDFPKLGECFPDVIVRGGVMVLWWDRNHDGPCEMQTRWDGKLAGPVVSRPLDEFGDVLVRRNEAVPILRKVLAAGELNCQRRVSAPRPFGLPTNFAGHDSPHGLTDPVLVLATKRTLWAERAAVQRNRAWVDDWKVLVPAASDGEPYYPLPIFPLSRPPFVAGPGQVCTMTYLVAGRFDSETLAWRYATYLRTRFARFLIHLRKPTHHNKAGTFAFVPDVPLDRDWTDQELFDRYQLTAGERQFVHDTVREICPGGVGASELRLETVLDTSNGLRIS